MHVAFAFHGTQGGSRLFLSYIIGRVVLDALHSSTRRKVHLVPSDFENKPIYVRIQSNDTSKSVFAGPNFINPESAFRSIEKCTSCFLVHGAESTPPACFRCLWM